LNSYVVSRRDRLNLILGQVKYLAIKYQLWSVAGFYTWWSAIYDPTVCHFRVVGRRGFLLPQELYLSNEVSKNTSAKKSLAGSWKVLQQHAAC
jgi:hypothetical protein